MLTNDRFGAPTEGDAAAAAEVTGAAGRRGLGARHSPSALRLEVG